MSRDDPGGEPRLARQAAPPHLVLVGLPGAGKTTIGALAAARLGCAFLDFDTEIERRTGESISAIFAVRGEADFRRMERELTEEVATAPGMVLAPGGGWMTNPANTALLRSRARIIHLRVGVGTALDRLGPRSIDRPLLATSDPKAALEALWRARAPVYSRADAAIDTEVIDIQSVTLQVVKLATEWGWRVG